MNSCWRPGRRGRQVGVWLVLAWAGSLACVEAETECSPSGEIGSCCREDVDCWPLTCLEILPNGYCTELCSEDDPCPDNSRCVEVLWSSGDGVVNGTYCLQSCGGGLPLCRDDHQCLEMSNAEGTVCFY